MKRIDIEGQEPAVRQFLQDIAESKDTVEVLVKGQIALQILPPNVLIPAEMQGRMERLGELMAKARENAKRRGMSAIEIEHFVKNAVDEVRTRRKRSMTAPTIKGIPIDSASARP